MVSLLKSTILSVGLLAGLAATANAQSVSALSPDGNTPPSYGGTLQVQNARTGIAGSTQSFYPKPGGGGIWKGGSLSALGAICHRGTSIHYRGRPQTPLIKVQSTRRPQLQLKRSPSSGHALARNWRAGRSGV